MNQSSFLFQCCIAKRKNKIIIQSVYKNGAQTNAAVTLMMHCDDHYDDDDDDVDIVDDDEEGGGGHFLSVIALLT